MNTRKYLLVTFALASFTLISLHCHLLAGKRYRDANVNHKVEVNDEFDTDDITGRRPSEHKTLRRKNLGSQRKDAHRSGGKGDDKCRSLFSVDSAASLERMKTVHRLEAMTRKQIVSGDGTNATDEMRNNYNIILKTAQLIKHYKQSAPHKLFGDTYLPLTKMLPKFISYDSRSTDEVHNNNNNNNNDNRAKQILNNERKTENFLRWQNSDILPPGVQSRITRESLPFVPCAVRSYDNISEMFSCVSRRLATKDTLRIHFMGDSKIRYLIHQFLDRTNDAFHFKIQLKNETWPWVEARSEIMNGSKWDDFLATSPFQPRLQITFSFRRFVESRIPFGYQEPEEVLQLRRWANSVESPPDLLITGYTPWTMMQHMIWGEGPKRFTSEILEMLLEMHRKVVPLLETISQRTRVLFLPNSRLRRTAEKLRPNIRGALGDFYMDWSESTFLYLLEQYRLHQLQGMKYSHEDVMSTTRKNIVKVSKSVLGPAWQKWLSEVHRNLSRKGGNQTSLTNNSREKDVIEKVNDFKIPLASDGLYYNKSGDTFHEKPRSGWESDKHNSIYQNSVNKPPLVNFNSNFTDDQNLSFNFSSAKPLHLKEPNSAKYHEESRAFHDHLLPSSDDSGLWWWDAILPLNLAEILECQEMFDRGLTEDSLYRDKSLRCLDITHAGTVTLRDLTTMLLNLLCNTVLHSNADYCCT